MNFSRWVLSVAMLILGYLLYLIVGLLVVLMITNFFRADPNDVPAIAAFGACIVFGAGGALCCYLARKISVAPPKRG